MRDLSRMHETRNENLHVKLIKQQEGNDLLA